MKAHKFWAWATVICGVMCVVSGHKMLGGK